MAFADAYVAVDPSIILVANPSSTPPIAADLELKCTSNKVSLTPEDDEADVDSFCNPDGTVPGSTKWTFSADILLSFNSGADVGTWNTLHPQRKQKHTFKIKPKTGTTSPSIPEATFQAYLKSVPFIDSERGQSTRFTWELSVIGEPTFAVS